MPKKVDYKLVNICLLVLIIYFIYQSSGLWINIFYIVKKIIYPVFISFYLAYAFYPISKFFKRLKIPSLITTLIILFIIVLIVILFIYLLFPIVNKDLILLFNQIITFLEHISHKYNININNIEGLLINNFNTILINIGAFSSIIGKLFNYISLVIIVFSFFIYFLNYMDDIRNIIKKNISKKVFDVCICIDIELKKYFSSFIKIMFITLFEYGISLFIIGHPNYLLLGLLASVASFIPCFGGIIINVISAITAFVIGKSLFIRTIILIIILSFIDTYVINPYVYGKSNKIHPIITLLSFFIFGKLFGIIGIIISMPIVVIISTICRYLKEVNYVTKTKRNI